MNVRQPKEASTSDAPKGLRAKVVQERSRQTRRAIVRSGIQLWTQRGFDEGFDTTTVDEIADHAGVSRATVYYYFPKKEDILREMAWVTAEELYEAALRSMMSGEPVDMVLDKIMEQLGRKVSRSPSAIVRRMLQLRGNDADMLNRDASGGLTRSFSVVLAHAQQNGELSRQIDSSEVAEVLSSICMGCIARWTLMDTFDLTAAMRRRCALTLAGARALAEADQPALASRA